jgi:cytidine deaminase
MTPSPDDLLSELLERARAARARAYAPYSGFAVGAALATASGRIVEGCNVENASYGLSLCAERVALAAAVAAGDRAFVALAVAGPDGVATAPCGACRQVLAEFAPDLRIVYALPGGVAETTLGALLPAAFALRRASGDHA